MAPALRDGPYSTQERNRMQEGPTEASKVGSSSFLSWGLLSQEFLLFYYYYLRFYLFF